MERRDVDVVVLLRGLVSGKSDISFVSNLFSSQANCPVLKLPKDLQNALGGLFKVIFNPELRGDLGIVVLAPGQTTPACLAQFEQLSMTCVCSLLQLICLMLFS